MPWLPMYIDKLDLEMLINWLNEDINIAFIVADGSKRWKAVSYIEKYEDNRHCLWHRESDPLPLLRKLLPDGKISDPFTGWKETKTGADPKVPYFGAGHPGVYWLNARVESINNSAYLGLSSFEWIGNRYRALGIEANPATKKWWERMQRWVKKQAVKIPRDGSWDGNNPEIWAFPSALRKIKSGRKRDSNP